MMPNTRFLLTLAAIICLSSGSFTHHARAQRMPETPAEALEQLKRRVAPDSHLAIFDVKARAEGEGYALSGEVDQAEAKRQAVEAVTRLGVKVTDEITVLPAANLGGKTWGIASLSIVNVREKPGNASEMGTQILLGNAFKILKRETNWYLVQSADRYLGWTEGGAFAVVTEEDVKNWNEGAAADRHGFGGSNPGAAGGGRGAGVGCGPMRPGQTRGRDGRLEQGVRCPTGARVSCRRRRQWSMRRGARSGGQRRTTSSGRPSRFWGGLISGGCNSPRGMDCSGFTKLVYYLNGVALDRNASQQALQGEEIPIDANFSRLKKGDLLFFGHHASANGPEHVNHVGIYLGDKLFIQSSGMVRISSLDPDSPAHDERRLRGLLHARRTLPE